MATIHRSTHAFSCARCLCRKYSSKSFLRNLFEKLREESSRDVELKENIRKFREETAKLEQSAELKSVREFYKKIEKELPTDAVDKLRERMESFKQIIREEGSSISNNDAVRKRVGNLLKASEQILEATKSLGQTELLKAAIKSAEAVGHELQSDRAKMYVAPEQLMTRADIAGKTEKTFDPDTESSGVVLHKDSKWLNAWQDFKDNNQYVQKFFDLKAQYEESEHVLARSMRFLSDRASQLFSGLKSNNELRTVLDEITKIDSRFDTESFLRYCRFVVIPNVLEAIVRGDLEILKDWCYEAPYNILATPTQQMRQLGLVSKSRILDVQSPDIQMGKMMEQGPVLVISFQAQQINCIYDKNGCIHEGDPNKVLRVTHVWALCRDQEEFNPLAAWRILDIAMLPSEQWL